MVCMNKLFNQQYFKYLYKSNRRLLILIWAILFICICFFTTIFTINDFTAYSEVQTFVTAMSGFCGISISMFVPIYFFRFLYRKRSCDLYFGLPIRKKELFSTTFLFGYLAVSYTHLDVYKRQVHHGEYPRFHECGKISMGGFPTR